MTFDELLDRFTAAVEARNGAALAALFTEDGVYHDVFYGSFTGRTAIAGLIDDWFHRTAEGFRWDMKERVAGPDLGLARYVFSYATKLPEAAGERVMFEGVALMTLRDGLIAEYHEVANTGPAFAQLRFAPERTVKIMQRFADELRGRPESRRHVAP
ncbi:nuclear transport factor 2 family protein [Marinibaculum pumilum]|uniref:Nuclear transport factor 2 family protein n=1 Tax=Marinibaculum pumilum TaxID=1766165 RepID=A0ABV7KXK0_9PROT